MAEATAPTASWRVEDWWGTAAVSTADAPRGCISATAAVRTAIEPRASEPRAFERVEGRARESARLSWSSFDGVDPQRHNEATRMAFRAPTGGPIAASGMLTREQVQEIDTGVAWMQGHTVPFERIAFACLRCNEVVMRACGLSGTRQCGTCSPCIQVWRQSDEPWMLVRAGLT